MSTLTILNMTRDVNGQNAYGLPYSNSKYMSLLTQNVVSTLTVPFNGNATYSNIVAVFSYNPGSSVWSGINEIPVLPISDVFTLATGEQNAAVRYLKSGDVINFITPNTNAYVGVTFYAVS